MNNKKTIIYAICLFCVMAVIFAFSSQNKEESNALSMSISNKIENVVEINSKKSFVNEDEKNEYFKKITSKINSILRKNAHAFLYAMFGLFAFLLFTNEGRGDYTASIYTLIASVLYAASDEMHQILSQSRNGRFKDVCIDVFGTVIMLIIIYFVKKIKEKGGKTQ